MQKLKYENGIGLVTFISIFAGIIIIAGIILGAIVVNKNLNKQSISANEFKKMMEEKDF